MRKPWVLAMLEMGIFAGMWAITVLGISVPSIQLAAEWPGPESMHKRRYRSIRIPRAVYERVVNRLSVK
jgi:hypothetical protein